MPGQKFVELHLPYSWEFNKYIRSTVTLDATLKDRTPAPTVVPLQVAELKWGKVSNFQKSVSTAAGGGNTAPSYVELLPDEEDEEDPPPPRPKLLEFVEIQRTVKDVTIYNPADHEQYVVFQQIQNIIFQAPSSLASDLAGVLAGTVGELVFKYTLKNPSVT